MEVLIIFLLILLNGVFSMSEIALVSARKSRLEAAAKRGDRNARIALETANEPNRFLSTVQIGITLIGILTGIFGGESVTRSIEEKLNDINFLAPYAHSLAVTAVVVLITFFSLVLGELVPKRIGLTNPEGIAKVMARPMLILSKVTAPFVWLLTFTSDLLIRVFRIRPSADSKVTEEEIRAIIQEGTEGGSVQEIEQDIVERVFILGDRKVASLMTHRNDIAFLSTTWEAEKVRSRVLEEMHSLYPVYEEEKDDIIGVVLLKDIFRQLSEPGFSLKDMLSVPQFMSENVSAYDALKRFKESGVHYGLVMDEFGQIQGIVTMNDLLEALVGDYSDFYAEEFTFVQREDGSWLIDGQYPMHDFLRKFGLDDSDNEFPFNTISGLIIHELQTIPQTGQKLRWLNFELEVVDMDGARIDKILLRRLEDR
ncbi:MAG: HlyC/CorC family transporter [Bacteroidia bacterium]|nr:HlyC/CorC family transporter [Bacteroidia bacterium]